MLLASSLEMIVIGQQMSYKKKKKDTGHSVVFLFGRRAAVLSESEKKQKN